MTFCSNCGQEIINPGNFCSKCGKGTSVTVAENIQDGATASGILEVQTDGRGPTSSSGSGNKIKTFSAYRKSKGHLWKEKVGKAAVKGKEKDQEVAITIGIMEFYEKESRLKPMRGKRVMLKISNTAPYADVRTQAEAKFKAYHTNCYIEGEEYRLLYESGEEAQFLPGTREFFNLKRYQDELGKDYKRIVLYLCTSDDLKASEKQVEENVTSEEEDHHPPEKKVKGQIESDEMLARKLQSEMQNENAGDQSFHGVNNERGSFTCESSSQEDLHKFDSCLSLISCLQEKINKQDQMFIVVRRGSTLQRYLTIWQREAKRHSPENLLRVHFAGEDGIDSGAMAKEFLTTAIDNVRSQIFPNGGPIDSMLYVHNGFFYACGQVCIVSIAQGGPPPCLFEECVYDMLINQEVQMDQLTAEHLTKHERELLGRIENDPIAFQETILEHGYTRAIKADHIKDILGTVMLSIVSRRLLHLKEFKKGLDQYGFLGVLQGNADLCKKLFLVNQDKVDANYVVSLLRPQFSEQGTSKRTVEESVFDYLQDFVMSIEDIKVTGYTEELAFDHEDTEDQVGQSKSEEVLEVQCADISPPGFLKWLTGQKHRPVDGDKLLITIKFDHECLQRNPHHTICFPVVGACARIFTLPVTHMQEEEEFRRIMLLAFCKGQAFGIR